MYLGSAELLFHHNQGFADPNYGDWLDWWHSPVIRNLTGTALITLGGCLHRMWTKPHPYFEPRMWTYRHLVPILLVMVAVEGLLASEHVLEEIFYEEVMDYEMLTSSTLCLWALPGIWAGCLLSWLWLKHWRFNVYKLIAIGLIGVTIYAGCFHFLVADYINIELLRLPIICRGFGYAVISIALMWSLHHIMSFEHFFQSLSVFNFMHMYIGGVIGCALYAWGMEGFVQSMMAVTIKQLYGWVLYICGFFAIGFLLWDIPMVRRKTSSIPFWPYVGLKALRKKIK